MGTNKKKWKKIEEEALRAGVKKHGKGKWKNILQDPNFSQLLKLRSNIDLKDKWRNLTGQGSTQLTREVGSSEPSELEAQRKLESELKCLREELKQIRDDRACQQKQVKDLTAEVAKYKKERNAFESELKCLREELKQIRDDRACQQKQVKDLTAEVAKYKKERNAFEETCSSQKDAILQLQLKLREGEDLRKKMHNTILELKGNIRVFCRVRPLLPDDGTGTDMVVSYPTSTEALGRGIELVKDGEKHSFTFDKVFDHDASQNDVFLEISELVQSALDGYKVCIFAYGQTGSGKTHTMMGKPDPPDSKGLIPRSLEQIFRTSQSLKDQGWKYKIQASILEIYNREIRDLLLNRPCGPGKKCIRHDANRNAFVPDLTIVDVCSVNDISSLLNRAAQYRSVGRTQMNEESSRSHFVLTVRICGTNENTKQQVQGVLNLIDLAGTARVSSSGATGDQLKENQAINDSLSSLRDVICALVEKAKHVPFRNSKLTELLQPYLGGDSKTLMFVNIAPDQSSTSESLCSLHWAARGNDIGIPKPKETGKRPCTAAPTLKKRPRIAR